MPITALPTPPQPSDSPATFNSRAFDLLGALPAFVTEANALEAENAAAATAAANAVLASKTTGPASSTDNTLPRFDGTTGKLLQGSGVVVDDSSNMGVGRSPNYRVDAYLSGSGSPAIASSNDSMVTVLQSVGTTQASVGTLTSHPLVFLTGNTERARIDLSGNLTLSAGALGYGAGAGGTVTQATSKTTGVTLNKPSGRITMHNAALAAGATVEFLVNNSFIGDASGVLATGKSWSTFYRIEATNSAAGFFGLRITNTSGGSRSDAVVIDFQVIQGSTT